MLVCVPKAWRPGGPAVKEAIQFALILRLMIAYHTTEKWRGFEAEAANLLGLLNEGSEDRVNGAARSMSTKPSCCGNIDGLRDTGQWFSITSDVSGFHPPKKSVNDMLLSIFPLQSQQHAACSFPPQCFYFVRAALPDSWTLHQWSERQFCFQMLLPVTNRANAPSSLTSAVWLCWVLCLTGLSFAGTADTRSLHVFRAILMQATMCALLHSAFTYKREGILSLKQRRVFFPQPTLWTSSEVNILGKNMAAMLCSSFFPSPASKFPRETGACRSDKRSQKKRESKRHTFKFHRYRFSLAP